MKTTPYPEDESEFPDYSFNEAPRCGARTKYNNGNPCRCPAVRNKNCYRPHGSAKGGGQKGNQNAFKHGYTGAQSKLLRKTIKQIIKDSYILMDKCK